VNEKHYLIDYKKKKYLFVIWLNIFVSVAEIVAGVISNSVSLISDGLHNFEDSFSLVISYIAWKFSFKKPDFNKTYGYKRIEIIAAFLNSIFLFGVCLFIFFESIFKFLNPSSINSKVMFSVGLITFFVNIFSAFLLHKDSSENINWKSSYLHLLGDSFFSIAIVIGAYFIEKFGVLFIDPLLSVLISIYIAYQSYEVIKKTFNILMQASPDIDYIQIKKDIESLENVKNVHHIHCWMGDEKNLYFEAHVEVGDCLISSTCDLKKQIEKILSEKYLINHSTIQFEVDVCRIKEVIYEHKESF
jgi:cobalt-zinc-cadmium efflux system protein